MSAIPKFSGTGVILALQTSVYQDLPLSATFIPFNYDLDMSATFITETTSGAVPVIVASGQALNLVGSGTTLAVSQTVRAASGSLYGFQMSGDGDGVYEVYYNSSPWMRFTTNIVVPNITYNFPAAITINNGDNISIYVTNTDTTTQNYIAAIIGSF